MSSGLSCAAAPGALLHMHAIKCAVMKNATGDFGILTNLYKKGGVRTCMNNTYIYYCFKYKNIPPGDISVLVKMMMVYTSLGISRASSRK